jgi:hypothetical protein
MRPAPVPEFIGGAVDTSKTGDLAKTPSTQRGNAPCGSLGVLGVLARVSGLWLRGPFGGVSGS